MTTETEIRIKLKMPSKTVKDIQYYDAKEGWKSGSDTEPPHGHVADVDNITLIRYAEQSPAWCCVRIGGTCKWVPC